MRVVKLKELKIKMKKINIIKIIKAIKARIIKGYKKNMNLDLKVIMNIKNNMKIIKIGIKRK
jgi:hypothetical protein